MKNKLIYFLSHEKSLDKKCPYFYSRARIDPEPTSPAMEVKEKIIWKVNKRKRNTIIIKNICFQARMPSFVEEDREKDELELKAFN